MKTAAEDVLGISPDSSELLSLLRRWRSGDASATPELIWLDAAAMGNARGACTESGLIALNSDWALNASASELDAVYAEELGHWLDLRFNSGDMPGDEGARFAAALLGLEATDLAGSDNDAIKIRLNNTWVNAEASSQGNTTDDNLTGTDGADALFGYGGSDTLIHASFSSAQITGESIAIDPGLIALAYAGDTTGNGTLSSLDASRIQQQVVGIDVHSFPNTPQQ